MVASIQMAHSQVLLSLIFGDNLQTEKLEFGMNGGFNLSTIRGIDGAKGQNNWELGFYFDIHPKLESPLHIVTGVYVKSNVGATNIPLDHPGNPPINDSVYNGFVNAGGSVEKVMNTFYVPMNLQYMTKARIFVEAGAQVGLVFKTRDLYQADVDGYTLHYEVKQKLSNNQTYRWIDAGVNGGIGYKTKGKLGMKIGVWYYYGLVNIYKDDINAKAYNQSLYVLATIPIGKKKAAEARAKREAAEAEGK
jgi:hypothetical protein